MTGPGRDGNPAGPPGPDRACVSRANAIRGQQTNDILLSLAAAKVFEPRWSPPVIDEMRRNRPRDLSEADIDRRIRTMNKVFPKAMTRNVPPGLEDQMQADPKDKHVLAAAVHSESDVLVAENDTDFSPPGSGPHAMRVERVSEFLGRKLDEDPERVQQALQTMVSRYKRDPRTMSGLIDKMAGQQDLHAFAKKLNEMVPPEQRGKSETLTSTELTSVKHTALDGTPPPGRPQAPAQAPEAGNSTIEGPERSNEREI